MERDMFTIDAADAEVLRALGERVAELAASPGQQARRREWKRLNAVRPGRPMLHICQVCWHELADRTGLATQCRGSLALSVERQLRQKLYQAEHFPADTVCEAAVWTMAVTQDSGLVITHIFRGRLCRYVNQTRLRRIAYANGTYDRPGLGGRGVWRSRTPG
jgi:hypothetical protein